MKKKLGKTVAVAIMCGNKFLMGRRKNTKTYPGFWQFPGGSVNKWEPIQVAAMRELQEETAMEMPLHWFELFDAIKDDPSCEGCFIYKIFYPCRYGCYPKVQNTEPEKNCGWKWLTAKEALTKNLMPGIKGTIEALDNYENEYQQAVKKLQRK